MAKQRTDKCSWPSKFSPAEWVHFAAYLTEIICERKAFREYKTLPERFWQLPEWRAYYRFQITVLNRLRKRYTDDAIYYSFQSKDCQYTYSFNAPVFLRLLEQNKDYVAPKHTVTEPEQIVMAVRPNFNQKKNFMSELD